MSAGNRIGGVIALTVNGVILPAKSGFTANDGSPLKAGVKGQDFVHGHTVEPQIAFIEGVISVTDKIKVRELKALTGATVMLEASNQTWILNNAYYANEGTFTAESGELPFRFEGDGDIDE